MTSFTGKYAALAPRAEYLQDIVVLAQAWKKSHTYIRRHNWYADTLELDASAINLQEKLGLWAAELQQGTFKPKPAQVVPAPKNLPWSFSAASQDGWSPVAKDDELHLRPLAHIGIREQTIATAAMLCLADCIETAQGNTSIEGGQALTRGVFSYGNRLHCNWSEDSTRARFAWGNSNVYSRYFQDYQAFVKRPLVSAQKVAESGDLDGSLFVVKLDISAFYDSIDVKKLVLSLKREYEAFRQGDDSIGASDETFWALLRESLSIPWEKGSESLASLFKTGALPGGLPQGLVSSGFFANAYLLQFDRAIGDVVEQGFVKIERHLFQLHDYCRYVDDLRLVVSCDEDMTDMQVGAAMSDWVQKLLNRHASSGAELTLSINPRKTEVEPYSSVGGEAGTAARMKSLQQQLSGPFDVAALQQVEGGLNGLLALAELGAGRVGVLDDGENAPTLASVARPKLEVRDDTLTRFSAYRLTKALRMRRSMTDLSQRTDDSLAEDVLRHDFEVAARRLVASWASNPSLVQVLLYALDLFPAPELLGIVTDALMTKLRNNKRARQNQYERRVALYVISELFRAGATYTGHRAEEDSNFKVGDIAAYRAKLGMFALAVMNESRIPWYVLQQGSLLLATLGTEHPELPDHPTLRYHRFLQSYLDRSISPPRLPLGDAVSTSLIGHQLLRKPLWYARWLSRFAETLSPAEQEVVMELIAQVDTPLLEYVIKQKVIELDVNHTLRKIYSRRYSRKRTVSDTSELTPEKWISLNDAITHPSKPFHQENGLLQLALALSEAEGSDVVKSEHMTPQTVRIKCADWSLLNDPRDARLTAKIDASHIRTDARYATPEWCATESAPLYALGRLLRAAATGELDFTAGHWLLREADASWYAGFRSTWQKRRMGLMNAASALGGTTGAITPWFSELLMWLLRWPGTLVQDEPDRLFSALADVKDFKRLITARLQHQAVIFGKGSNLPVYEYPVIWPMHGKKTLRVCLVQGLMPLTEHFVPSLASLESPAYRLRHRNHTASLLYLATQQIQARDAVLGMTEKPHVDLVVLPEYSVHVDDQDLMRSFSDATGAMLFYGLCGAMDPTTKEPVNAARWLVPQRRGGRRSWVEVDQGKMFPTPEETVLGVKPWRPHQVIIELRSHNTVLFRMSGAVCYDATDLRLAADLRDESHMFVVTAMNRDVKTFDSMVGMLRYHMYQHVLIANSGEFGGSTAQAPYEKEYERLIAHSHGSKQMSVNIFDINIDHFGPGLQAAETKLVTIGAKKQRIGKTPPAGLNRKK
ncbi:Reverse transcriptase (RNA-dependent DNA polymerase) [Paraburkholderia phenazinium]|uniref:Reverse transcriptase (RNA-dependent DNA polymerase) n=1 Tax=Paraburkholderia phenazinium TaxID=60549 RepID=A0A1G7WRZ2_9BURK|nr:RNA-directed DNA polymerase [Paraburkholderia phenazinium]SDG74658.1 Reverse transcriptase (RNA-dependent DNA polymerase) [Paraburkholderia phenazinium]